MKKSLVFGGKCSELLATLDQESLSWKTCQMSFDWVDPSFLDRLPQSGTVQNGQLFGLQISEHLTKGPGGFVFVGIQDQSKIKQNLLPTPITHTWKNTPGTPSAWNQHSDLNVEIAKRLGYTKDTIGQSFRLNPPFVEEMMGFPTGWTELEPLETQ